MNENADLSHRIWQSRYRWRVDDNTQQETDIEQTWRRVARALAVVEPADRSDWEARFLAALRDFRFLPGGRILAGAGTGHAVTLFNCFVMGTIEDSIDGIFKALKEGALTMREGGGVGYDFSTLRPCGDMPKGVAAIAPGPVSYMRIWDAMCATILSSGARRGAMMGTLRCDHPDIEDFIRAKQERTELRRFNLSVLVTKDFMQALAADLEWPLVFPLQPGEPGAGDIVQRNWPGSLGLQPCRVHRRVPARALWRQIMRANYDYAEPGVIYIDRVQRRNNLWYCEQISATNPCGEVPLPPYGACDLGSINLTRFVRQPFTDQAVIDWQGIAEIATVATRMLDNVYDCSHFPLAEQQEVGRRSRRVGLGVTGLADALVILGVRYDTTQACELAGRIMGVVCHAAYRASVALAREKGPFADFSATPYLQGEFIAGLPRDITAGIARHGIRNSHLTAIAPTGTISLLAGNVSSGLEPIFAAEYSRQVRESSRTAQMIQAVDYAVAMYRRITTAKDDLPPTFVTAAEIAPEAQLAMQAALQPYVDNAISKTIAVPEDFDIGRFSLIFEEAYRLGLKGCTTFRPNPVTGAVLTERASEADLCCGRPTGSMAEDAPS